MARMKWNRTTLVVLAFVSLLAGSSVVAQTQPEATSSKVVEEVNRIKKENRLRRLRGEPEYLLGMDLCRQNGFGRFAKAYAEVVWYSAKEIAQVYLVDAEALSRILKNHFVAPEIKLLLEREGFSQALEDCGQAVAVLNGVRNADLAGKAIAIPGVPLLARPVLSRMKVGATATKLQLYTQATLFSFAFTYAVNQIAKLYEIVTKSDEIEQGFANLVAQKRTAVRNGVRGLQELGDEVIVTRIRELKEALLQDGLTADEVATLTAEQERYEQIFLMRKARRAEDIRATISTAAALGQTIAASGAQVK